MSQYSIIHLCLFVFLRSRTMVASSSFANTTTSLAPGELGVQNWWAGFSTEPANISSYCVSSLKANYSSWTMTNPVVTLSTYSTKSRTYTAFSTPFWRGGYSSPCCGQCTVEMHQMAEVFYWPFQTATGSIPTVVNADGYTL